MYIKYLKYKLKYHMFREKLKTGGCMSVSNGSNISANTFKLIIIKIGRDYDIYNLELNYENFNNIYITVFDKISKTYYILDLKVSLYHLLENITIEYLQFNKFLSINPYTDDSTGSIDIQTYEKKIFNSDIKINKLEIIFYIINEFYKLLSISKIIINDSVKFYCKGKIINGKLFRLFRKEICQNSIYVKYGFTNECNIEHIEEVFTKLSILTNEQVVNELNHYLECLENGKSKDKVIYKNGFFAYIKKLLDFNSEFTKVIDLEEDKQIGGQIPIDEIHTFKSNIQLVLDYLTECSPEINKTFDFFKSIFDQPDCNLLDDKSIILIQSLEYIILNLRYL